MSDFLVCSFHTDDDYYRQHGKELEKNLSELGVRYVIEEITKQDGEEWPDLCRRKVPFLKRVCDENPDSRVFWIDVDCRLISLPQFVREFTADILGFQRGFSTPRAIGYHKRSRFWEPCFWGVNTTPQARQMITDAAELESRSKTRATDDYFFEEGWRANAPDLTFQVIPSTCVAGKGGLHTTRSAFFTFGSSGNVADFKGQVAQHVSDAPATVRGVRTARSLVVRLGKRVLKHLPPTWRRRIIAAFDSTGATAVLVAHNSIVPTPGLTPATYRKALANKILRGGLDGDAETLEAASDELLGVGVLTHQERGTIAAARSFAYYASRSTDEELELMWWARPFPGNFGDWLSPLVISNYTTQRIKFRSPTSVSLASGRHMVAIGSIGRFIKPQSVVVGTGISSDEYRLDPAAQYVSLRGPLAAKHLLECGGPTVTSFGDPGALISRVIPVTRGVTNGRTAFVRHHSHRNLPIVLPERYDELTILTSHPDAIRRLILDIAHYDRVVTSAMHILIACQSYGIPCALVAFEGFLSAVAGNGMKYTDYSLGVGLEPLSPTPVPLDIRAVDIESLVLEVRISEDRKDEIEDAVRRAVVAVAR